MQYARVVDTIVVESVVPVEGFTIEQCFPADFLRECHPCSKDVQPGWVWNGYSFSPPAPPVTPMLEDMRSAKIREIMSAYEAAFAPVSAIYPITEREGWRIQEAEARAVLADPAADAPVLTIMAAQRGKDESVPELAQVVLDRVAEYQRVYASLTGQQQRMYAEIMALDNADAVLAYPVEYQTP